MAGGSVAAATGVVPGSPTTMVDTRLTFSSPCRRYLITGRTSNWWNAGGDESVHSRVVAPAPHGLAAACSRRINAWAIANRNTSKPSPEMYDPMEEIKFQSANAYG